MILPEQITSMHILLAYAGMILHLLLKMNKARKKPEFTTKEFFKRNIIVIITSVMMIPLILIIACDYPDVVPINNTTAVFAGWQTNSLFRNLMTSYAERIGAQIEDDE